jgi:hypothetical protein
VGLAKVSKRIAGQEAATEEAAQPRPWQYHAVAVRLVQEVVRRQQAAWHSYACVIVIVINAQLSVIRQYELTSAKA